MGHDRISSSLASENEAPWPRNLSLSLVRHVGLKTGFFQGGATVCYSSHSQAGCHLGALNNPIAHITPGPIKSESGRRTQVSVFLKVPPSDYHLQPSLRTCCLSPKILGYGMGMRVFKRLCDGGYYCYFHSIMFPYIITMGRRKRNCLSLNTSRREQCYFQTRGKSSWHCLKLSVRKTNHLCERDRIGTIYFNRHLIF